MKQNEDSYGEKIQETVKLSTTQKLLKRYGIFLPVVVLAILLSLGVAAYRIPSMMQESKLQKLADTVILNIEENDFVSAYENANAIYYTAGWSAEIKEKWDFVRSDLIQQIKEAEENTNTETKE